MIDIIVRDCGYGEFLPLIIVTPNCGSAMQGKELYRGDRVNGREAAFLRAKTAWDESGTGNITEFKRANGL
jgi:hypothetical protein